jgi:hypothetical protein
MPTETPEFGDYFCKHLGSKVRILDGKPVCPLPDRTQNCPPDDAGCLAQLVVLCSNHYELQGDLHRYCASQKLIWQNTELHFPCRNSPKICSFAQSSPSSQPGIQTTYPTRELPYVPNAIAHRPLNRNPIKL